MFLFISGKIKAASKNKIHMRELLKDVHLKIKWLDHVGLLNCLESILNPPAAVASRNNSFVASVEGKLYD